MWSILKRQNLLPLWGYSFLSEQPPMQKGPAVRESQWELTKYSTEDVQEDHGRIE